LQGFDALNYEEHLDYELVQSTNPEFNKETYRHACSFSYSRQYFNVDEKNVDEVIYKKTGSYMV
jgi:hypothetical protein